jgi:hypothetical protein
LVRFFHRYAPSQNGWTEDVVNFDVPPSDILFYLSTAVNST